MTGEENFARRWSRLKREALVPLAPVPSAQTPAPEAAEVELEEIPPPVDSIALDEMAGWLKRRVPEAWRQAALRRLWVADPVIRNFIGPADYAWDWNIPGNAPGWGPLRALDDVGKLLARAIGEPLPPPPENVQEAGLVQEGEHESPAPVQDKSELIEIPVLEQIPHSPQRDDPLPQRRSRGRATPV